MFWSSGSPASRAHMVCIRKKGEGRVSRRKKRRYENGKRRGKTHLNRRGVVSLEARSRDDFTESVDVGPLSKIRGWISQRELKARVERETTRLRQRTSDLEESSLCDQLAIVGRRARVHLLHSSVSRRDGSCNRSDGSRSSVEDGS